MSIEYDNPHKAQNEANYIPPEPGKIKLMYKSETWNVKCYNPPWYVMVGEYIGVVFKEALQI